MNEYRDVIKTIEKLLESTEDKISALDFAIEMIGREAVYILSNKLFYLAGNDLPENYADRLLLPFIDPVLRTEEKLIYFSLLDRNVLCSPWALDRLGMAIDDITKQGYIPDPQNIAEGVFYPELKMGIITEGYHHTYVAESENCGKANMYIKSLVPYFDKVTTDGDFWYAEEKRYDVESYYMAILYKLAQMKHQMSKNIIS